MIILLNKRLDCETVCTKISKLIKDEIKDTKDLKDYALCITISKIVDEETQKNLTVKENK